jgi:nucleotide-binding universal stress UspA family protein
VAAVDFIERDDIDSEVEALNQHILGLASSLALSDFAQLHLVHAWDAPEAGFANLLADHPDLAETNMIEEARTWHKRRMDNLTRELCERIGAETYKYLSPRVHLPKGSARKAVPALAKELEADLVVMGTVARTGIPGFIIGNTAETILDQLQCSVLALKPPAFVSPVPRDL